MNITLNGDGQVVPTGATILALIESVGLLPEATAVQRNGEIVPRSAYADTILAEGDTVELVRFVGGG